jgi:hypothetical protein
MRATAPRRPSPAPPVPPGPRSGHRTIQVFRTSAEIEGLRHLWEVWPSHRDSDIDLLLMSCRTSSEMSPYVLVLSRDGEPDALLAGAIVLRRLAFRVGYLDVVKPLVRVLSFSYGGLLGNASAENCSLLLAEIMKSLKNGEGDLALFDHVDATSPLFAGIKTTPGFFFRDHIAQIRPHRVRELPNGVEKLYAGLSTSQKSHFRYTAKRLTADYPGQIRLSRYRDPADLGRALAEVEEIAKKTWQWKIGSGFHASGGLLDLLNMEAEMGWLRVYVLRLQEKPCAFWIGTVYQNTFHSDFTGYDPEYSHYSPGLYLLCQILEDCCTNGVRALDFGFSDEAYKRRFGNTVRQEASLHMFAPTMNGLGLNIMRTATTAINESVREVLDRTQFMQKVKKTWRKIARGKAAGENLTHNP